LKTSYLAIGIVGILLILAGIVFSLQGMNVIKNSPVMSGVSFWIYAGFGVAVVGIILAFLGFYMGSKSTSTSKKPMTGEDKNKTAGVGVTAPDSPTQNKESTSSS
jgi:uncharacterized membrane protein